MFQPRVVTGSHDGTIRLWDGEDGEELVCIPAAHGTRTTTIIQDDGNEDSRNDNNRSRANPNNNDEYGQQCSCERSDGGGGESPLFVRALALTAAQTRTDAKDFSRVSALSQSSDPADD